MKRLCPGCNCHIGIPMPDNPLACVTTGDNGPVTIWHVQCLVNAHRDLSQTVMKTWGTERGKAYEWQDK